MLEIFFMILAVFLFQTYVWPRQPRRSPFEQRFVWYVQSHGDPLPPWLQGA